LRKKELNISKMMLSCKPLIILVSLEQIRQLHIIQQQQQEQKQKQQQEQQQQQLEQI